MYIVSIFHLDYCLKVTLTLKNLDLYIDLVYIGFIILYVGYVYMYYYLEIFSCWEWGVVFSIRFRDFLVLCRAL